MNDVMITVFIVSTIVQLIMWGVLINMVIQLIRVRFDVEWYYTTGAGLLLILGVCTSWFYVSKILIPLTQL